MTADATQSLVGVHGEPAAHATHVPDPLHTPPGQPVPGAAFPLTLHTGAPLEQSIAPVVHGLPVPHDAPCEHATHTPLPLHTAFDPHVPHDPPHASPPQLRPLHCGAHTHCPAPLQL